MPGQAPPAPQPLPGVSSIIAVGSGKGGVGKTTLAVNLAIALARMGHKVGLLDADVYGPNVPLMLGSSEPPSVAGENRIVPPERYGMKVISVGFLSPGDKPLVWRGPMLHSIIKQFLSQVEWGQLDYLVVDLPPGTGDVVISLVQTVPLTGAVVVTTPSDVSLQDARKAIEMFRQVKVDILGIVENMSYFVCPHCHQEIDVFSKGGGQRTALQFGVPFLGSIELDPDIRRGGDSGHPIVMEGDQSPHAKSLFAFTRRVIERTKEVQESAGGSVIEIR
ncbi:MAG TPA: Mrp/NBP35 family ATP-binding protein [Candidatus Binatia bacterium]|nr:Mrp/NBP35 family ATP-binding protein [Candidatus Binatia bacterium]